LGKSQIPKKIDAPEDILDRSKENPPEDKHPYEKPKPEKSKPNTSQVLNIGSFKFNT
jgi:hypothetical protein